MMTCGQKEYVRDIPKSGTFRPMTTRINTDELKARVRLSAIIGRVVKLRKTGHELEGLCPFHAEKTPSFRVNDAKGVYNCFGCGASGDAIRFLMDHERMTFLEAARALADDANMPALTPKERQQQTRAETADRAAAILSAQAQWHDARPIRGTPAELYLRSRGIVGAMPPTIRFVRAPAWKNPKTGADGPALPALIAACQNTAGKIVGVQRVFLTKEGRKANMANPKLSLGQVRGCAVRLGPIAPHIILCEGPEDGLTLRQKHPRASVWVSLGTGAMPHIELPEAIRRVTIAGDNNAPGRLAVETASAAFIKQGRKVDAIYPPRQFTDWNDELMGVMA